MGVLVAQPKETTTDLVPNILATTNGGIVGFLATDK
jgi:hypothetical protein